MYVNKITFFFAFGRELKGVYGICDWHAQATLKYYELLSAPYYIRNQVSWIVRSRSLGTTLAAAQHNCSSVDGVAVYFVFCQCLLMLTSSSHRTQLSWCWCMCVCALEPKLRFSATITLAKTHRRKLNGSHFWNVVKWRDRPFCARKYFHENLLIYEKRYFVFYSEWFSGPFLCYLSLSLSLSLSSQCIFNTAF